MGTKNLALLKLKIPMARKIGLMGQFSLWILGKPYKTPAGNEPVANKKSKLVSSNLFFMDLRNHEFIFLSKNNLKPIIISFLNFDSSSKISLVLLT